MVIRITSALSFSTDSLWAKNCVKTTDKLRIILSILHYNYVHVQVNLRFLTNDASGISMKATGRN